MTDASSDAREVPSDDESSPLEAVLRAAADTLAEAGVPSPRVDAEVLAAHLLGVGRGRVQALALSGVRIESADAATLVEYVQRRAAREPLQHIVGSAAFRRIELAVGPGVFVPRPETEGVAGLAIDALRASAGESPIAVDLGTGSGAIALSLAVEVPHARVFGIEKSPEAFAWADRNRRELGVDNAEILLGDLAEALPELDGTVSVVVSNPPYIPTWAIPRDPEVHLHDPRMALYGGEDGLDVVHAVSTTGLRLLHRGGTIVIEHGEEQGEQIRSLLTADGWRAAATHPDLTGRPRATTALR